ncbi:MAG: hypothetical protein ACE5RL_02270 [Nitrosarchaeum sp.]
MKSNNFFIITLISILVISSLGQQVLGYGGPPEQNSSGNYTVDINSDKESYGLGESVIFSGTVNRYNEDRDLRISLFDSNQNLVLTQKIPVDADSTFSYSFVLNNKFLNGEYHVKAQYGHSKATVKQMSFTIISNDTQPLESQLSPPSKIPDWIKSNAGWWAEGKIDDNSFVQGIQFLIKEGFMKI